MSPCLRFKNPICYCSFPKTQKTKLLHNKSPPSLCAVSTHLGFSPSRTVHNEQKKDTSVTVSTWRLLLLMWNTVVVSPAERAALPGGPVSTSRPIIPLTHGEHGGFMRRHRALTSLARFLENVNRQLKGMLRLFEVGEQFLSYLCKSQCGTYSRRCLACGLFGCKTWFVCCVFSEWGVKRNETNDQH